MKRLVIDINSIIPYFVSGRTTGISRSTLGLINSLADYVKGLPFEIVLYSQNVKGIGGKKLYSPFLFRHFYIPYREGINKFFRYLPIKELFIPYDLMHIPHNFTVLNKPDKTIVTLHDAIFMHYNEKAFNHLKMRRQVPVLMKKCKGIVTCSEASKRDIVNTMDIEPEKIDVIYWGINHKVFYYEGNKDLIKISIDQQFKIKRPYFLSVSCNAERKNTDKLLQSYIFFSKNLPKHDLILVWNNPPNFILEMVEHKRLKNRIHFLSDIADEQLALLYNGATALFFPSSYEGFGLPVLEAMACGTPVVTCLNSSLPEVGGDAALYMNDPVIENILYYLEGFENCNFNISQLSENGILQASKFRWDKTANEYISLYKKHLNIAI